jgi:SAM-dependent methyltransferase
VGVEPALGTYEKFAAVYNDFNWANDYEMWLGALLPELERHGLELGKMLDVGCGTGRAFAPMLRRGWEVTGCDISPAMLEVARGEHGDRVELAAVDMRELPVFGEFDLVLCMNDAINYLLEEGDLARALAGMGSNLKPGGLLLFDCNSEAVFSSAYLDEERAVEHGGRRWTWRGLGPLESGNNVYGAEIEGDDVEALISRERHYPIPEVLASLKTAGLELLAVLGQQEVDLKVKLVEPPDERRDYKIIYICRKPGNDASPLETRSRPSQLPSELPAARDAQT